MGRKVSSSNAIYDADSKIILIGVADLLLAFLVFIYSFLPTGFLLFEEIDRLALVSLSIVIACLFIPAGIGVLRIRSSGRKNHIQKASSAAAFVTFFIYAFIYQLIFDGNFLPNSGYFFSLSLLIITLIYFIWSIYYLTRQKVKEQFK